MEEQKIDSIIRIALESFAGGEITNQVEMVSSLLMPLLQVERLSPELVIMLESVADKEGRKVIHRLCESKITLKYLTQLLKRGLSVDSVDSQGETAVHYAAKAPHGQAILHLLGPYKPDYDKLNSEGLSPLNLCLLYKQFEVFQILLNKGASVKAKNGHQLDIREFIAALALKEAGEILDAQEASHPS